MVTPGRFQHLPGILRDKTARTALRDFLISEFSVENLLFLDDVLKYQHDVTVAQMDKEGIMDLFASAEGLYRKYISKTASYQVNLNAKLKRKYLSDVKILKAHVADPKARSLTSQLEKFEKRRMQRQSSRIVEQKDTNIEMQPMSRQTTIFSSMYEVQEADQVVEYTDINEDYIAYCENLSVSPYEIALKKQFIYLFKEQQEMIYQLIKRDSFARFQDSQYFFTLLEDTVERTNQKIGEA